MKNSSNFYCFLKFLSGICVLLAMATIIPAVLLWDKTNISTNGWNGIVGTWTAEKVATIGAFAIALLLIIPAVWGVWSAVIAIRQSREMPDLRLHLADQIQAMTQVDIGHLHTFEGGNTTQQRFNLIIRNTGTTIALWYSVRLEIPKAICDDGCMRRFDHDPQVLYLNPRQTNTENYMVTWRCKGNDPIFPDQTLPLHEFQLLLRPMGNWDAKRFHIKYTIYSDKAPMITGTLDFITDLNKKSFNNS